MPDPITSQLPDPQASVDAALGKLAGTPTPTVEDPKVEKAPVQTETTVPMSAPMGDDTPLAFAAPTLNAMPTTSPTTPTLTPGDTPVNPTVSTNTAEKVTPKQSTIETPKLEPMPSVGSSYLPPVPPAPITTPVDEKPKKKSKILLVIMGIFGLMGALGVGGYFAYQQYVTKNTVAIVSEYTSKAACEANCDGGHALAWTTRNGVTGCYWAARSCEIGNGNTTSGNESQCVGCKNGYNVRWNGSACIQVDRCNFGAINDSGSCKNSGGIWCDSVDSTGKAYKFCISSSGDKGCNQAAIEQGYTIGIGSVKCTPGKVEGVDSWVPDGTYRTGTNVDPATGRALDDNSIGAVYDPVSNKYLSVKDQVAKQCDSQYKVGKAGSTGFGSGSFICKIGVKGDGGEVYSGGACTAVNGKPFTGNLGCFCGTVQVDTPTGHTSTSSTCGCQQNNPETHKACNTTTKVCETVSGPGADTCTTDANCITTAPVLSCTGLTQTPNSTPAIGDTVTFTCAGSITPTGAATLSYKFRYSLNDGADQLMTNKTPTTAELQINACGTYSVQCKVCATINGVLTCNPTWQGAVQ